MPNPLYTYLPTPPLGQDMTQGQSLSLTGLNLEFPFSWISCLTKAEETSLPYNLPIAGGRIIGFISFARVLVLCEMQSVSCRIWTRITGSISYDYKHYITSTSFCIYFKYIWFGLVGFYGMSTIVGYLTPNLLYIYMYIYMKYMIFKHIL